MPPFVVVYALTCHPLPACKIHLGTSGESTEERESNDMTHVDLLSSSRSSEPGSIWLEVWPFPGECN
ncbi:hypothetical protein JHK82_052599 [Glycine max]|nr:hypothetical protein JHK86_052445 [Glycine max]KAG5082447.1 hypothetical protein JHK84_052485 [Glycine max]KAG5085202.1 hypothetical protein JHK82_052599 [Glycine max]